MKEAQQGPTDDRPERILPVLEVGQEVLYLGGDDIPFHFLFDVGDDLGHAEESHDSRNQAYAVAELQDAEGQALGAGDGIHTDGAEEQSEDKYHQRFEDRPRGQVDKNDDAQEHQAEIFRRPESQGELSQGWSHQHKADHRDGPGDEGAESRMPRAGPARPFKAI